MHKRFAKARVTDDVESLPVTTKEVIDRVVTSAKSVGPTLSSGSSRESRKVAFLELRFLDHYAVGWSSTKVLGVVDEGAGENEGDCALQDVDPFRRGDVAVGDGAFASRSQANTVDCYARVFHTS